MHWARRGLKSVGGWMDDRDFDLEMLLTGCSYGALVLMMYATPSYAEKMSTESHCARVQVEAGQVGCCSQVCCDPSMRRSSWQRTSLSMSGIDISHPNNCLNRPPPPSASTASVFSVQWGTAHWPHFRGRCVRRESMQVRNRNGRVSGSGSDRPVDRTAKVNSNSSFSARKGPRLFDRRSFFPLLQHELCDASTKVDSARGGWVGACEGRRTERGVRSWLTFWLSVE